MARYLLREIEAGGDPSDEQPVLTLPLAKSSIASYLGTVHETLSRTFAKFRNEKLIRLDGSRIEILEFDGLDAYLQS